MRPSGENTPPTPHQTLRNETSCNVSSANQNDGLVINLLLAILLLLGAHPTIAQRVSIGLFDSQNIQRVIVMPESDSYIVLFQGEKIPLKSRETVTISRVDNECELHIGSLAFGRAAHLAIISPHPDDRITVQPSQNNPTPRTYDGNLSLYSDFERLMCVNLVEQELYVAAVVLAEVGGGAHPEIYKAQSMLVRTYLYAQRKRHIQEGFNLCDEVHCQAYKGSAQQFPIITQAAQSTRRLVVVDERNQLITGVFHANCGGQTAASGDVWLTDYNYLKSKNDPYCRKGKGATWQAHVKLADWKRFLNSKGIDVSSIPHSSYNYTSPFREATYPLPGGKGVPFRDLREYFNLKSAWFSVQVQGEQIVLKGRGYGHGIGMCQEGAMRMANEGKRAEEIIHFYFHNVRIVPMDQSVLPDE